MEDKLTYTAILNTFMLDSVAQQIGELLGEVAEPSLLNAQPIELRETLEVWALGLDALAHGSASGKNLSQFARPTGRRHHQITFDGNPAAFARSSVSEAGCNPVVEELFTSPLAAKLDAAMEWVDQNVSGEPSARLLVVPARYLHALWLTGGANEAGHVLIVETAGTQQTQSGDAVNGFQNPQVYQLLEERKFLKYLANVPAPMGVLLGGGGKNAPTPTGVP